MLTDTDGDGVADKKQVFYTGVGNGRSGNVQQAQSGFVWGLDNWIYSTYNAVPLPLDASRHPARALRPSRRRVGHVDGRRREDLAGERGRRARTGQLPDSRFSTARSWCPTSGSADSRFRGRRPVIADMQGGLPRVRMPAGSLSHFTSTTGPEIVRSDRYPADLNGDLLFADPVGRFIRRSKIVKTDGLTQVRNAYPGSEFIISTRSALPARSTSSRGPTARSTSSTCTTASSRTRTGRRRGTYLRYKIQQYQLDKVDQPRPHLAAAVRRRARRNGRSRSAGSRPSPRSSSARTWPRMNDETPAQLVAHLTNPNGWWRDTAQTSARPEAGQVGRAAAPRDRAERRTASSAASTRCGRSKGWARSTPRSSASR